MTEGAAPVRHSIQRRMVLFFALAACVTAALLWVRADAARERARELAAIEAAVELDDLHLDLADLDTSGWVRQYRPERSAGGYTLVLYRRRVPMIIDMNSRVVHAWPHVRAAGRVRLDRHGRLAVNGTDGLVKEYDWDGNLQWYYDLPVEEDFPHHDLIQLESGNYLVLARDKATRTGYLQEVDRRGEVVWEWRSNNHIDDFPSWDRDRKDPTHINSIHELPTNPWFEAGDERFRPGNILISARHLNTVFIVDKESKEVVWKYSAGLDYQHEASMIPAGAEGAGHILLFNNGRHNLYRYRRSLVQAINPIEKEVAWEYGSDSFFSSVAGTVQRLPGGTLAVNSSHGGRVFEITKKGQIVWEWVPSYMPMRVERLAYDHCPQLAALPRPQEMPVTITGDKRPYIDMDLYKFALTEDFTLREVDGMERALLRTHNSCRELHMPPLSTMWIEFGIDMERLGDRWLEGRFVLSIGEKDNPRDVLFDTRLNPESKSPWRGRKFHLGKYSYKKIEMCIATEVESDLEDPFKMVAWANPLINSRVHRPHEVLSEVVLTDQERELREQQLKALGYVN